MMQLLPGTACVCGEQMVEEAAELAAAKLLHQQQHPPGAACTPFAAACHLPFDQPVRWQSVMVVTTGRVTNCPPFTGTCALSAVIDRSLR
jgi:hypothetical protein